MSGESQKSMRGVKNNLTDKKRINLNSKLSSRRNDGLHFFEEGLKITRNIYFDLKNNFLFMNFEDKNKRN
jgi:hypothetical protein